jgi:hypothetical protein
VTTRTQGDCGVRALALLAGIPYEDAIVAVSRVEPDYYGKKGLHGREVVRAAAKLKAPIRLRPTRRFNLDEDTGILRVRGPQLPRGGHFVTVIGARILCPVDATPCAWREYLARHEARACSLLKEVA